VRHAPCHLKPVGACGCTDVPSVIALWIGSMPACISQCRRSPSCRICASHAANGPIRALPGARRPCTPTAVVRERQGLARYPELHGWSGRIQRVTYAISVWDTEEHAGSFSADVGAIADEASEPRASDWAIRGRRGHDAADLSGDTPEPRAGTGSSLVEQERRGVKLSS
jgi:hypothetical protein